MPMQWGLTKIGAMQYNGVTIGEAMIDGVVVYRSVPPIGPVSGDYDEVAYMNQITIVATHTIEWDYEYVIQHTASVELSVLNIAAGIGINDVIVTEGPRGQDSTSTYVATLQAGDTVQIGVRNTLSADITTTGTWSITPTGDFGPDPRPVVTITGTSGNGSRNQFRQACIDFGTTFQAVEVLPFQLDTSQATNLASLFDGCSSLIQVPDLDTSQVTNMQYMFRGCSSLTQVSGLDTSQATNMTGMFIDCSSLTHVSDLDTAQALNVSQMFTNCGSLTDGNVRCIGKRSNVSTTLMIFGSGLTREPFYDINGNPI